MKVKPNDLNGNGFHVLEFKTEPAPTVDPPTYDELISMCVDGVCVSTDGCIVEPDGVCPHGYPSWLIQLGLI